MNFKHILIVFFLAIAGCNTNGQTPTEKQAQASLAIRVKKESNDHIQVVKLTKTNGELQSFGGQEKYVMYYDVLIEFTKDTYKACDQLNGCFYTYRDCTDYAPSGWEAYGKNIKHYANGELINVTKCKMYFSKTEQGWIADKVYR
jgi:hypothetical protein